VTEFPLARGDASTVAPEAPELFFSADLRGYGWCIRKGEYLNLGFGHCGSLSVAHATGAFAAFLERRGKAPRHRRWQWHGWAYRLGTGTRPRLVGDGVLLVGDAAGLSHTSSGEGIRPAIESGLMAARAIVEACGRYTSEELAGYDRRVRTRFVPRAWPPAVSRIASCDLALAFAHRLLAVPWLVRRTVLNGAFLRASDRPLSL